MARAWPPILRYQFLVLPLNLSEAKAGPKINRSGVPGYHPDAHHNGPLRENPFIELLNDGPTNPVAPNGRIEK